MEQAMKKIVLILAMLVWGSPAFATCKSDAAAKNLAGAALKSFLTQCVRDARTACTADQASLQRLSREARASQVRRCVAVAFGN
jgi:hypothetical protein